MVKSGKIFLLIAEISIFYPTPHKLLSVNLPPGKKVARYLNLPPSLDMERNSDEWIVTSEPDFDDIKLTIDNLSLRVLNYTLNENLYNKVNFVAILPPDFFYRLFTLDSRPSQ